MRYSRLATNDDSLDEYTPLMLSDQQGVSGTSPQHHHLNTADNAHLLPILCPSVQSSVGGGSSFGSNRSGFFNMLQ
ncbi:unnamed protein product [Meloidogyne enterolobii]